MKLAALVWLACLAIYLDLLWRARSRGKFIGPQPWPLLVVIAGGLAWIGWNLVFGWPAPDPITQLMTWLVADRPHLL